MREYQTLMDEMSNAVNDGCLKLKEEALINLDFFAVLELCWPFCVLLSVMMFHLSVPRNVNKSVMDLGSP